MAHLSGLPSKEQPGHEHLVGIIELSLPLDVEARAGKSSEDPDVDEDAKSSVASEPWKQTQHFNTLGSTVAPDATMKQIAWTAPKQSSWQQDCGTMCIGTPQSG